MISLFRTMTSVGQTHASFPHSLNDNQALGTMIKTTNGSGHRENLWGYAKRLRFVQQSIEEAFPVRTARSPRVLDVGCGNGSELALPLARQGFHVTGIDIHGPSIAHAKQLAGGLPNVTFECKSLEELNDQPFQVIILSEVLEHLDDPKALLKASVRHLSSDGIIVVTVPNGYGEFEIDSYFFNLLRLDRLVALVSRNETSVTAATDNHENGHVQFFTRGRLRRLFAECSLSIVRQASASLLAGPLIGHTLARSQWFVEWNSRVTDQLPWVLASGWYFCLRANTTGNGVSR